MEYLLKKKELDNSSRPNWTREKAAHQRKVPLVRKSFSLFLWVRLQKVIDEVSKNDDEREPVEPITSPCDSVLGYWGVKHQKSG